MQSMILLKNAQSKKCKILANLKLSREKEGLEEPKEVSALEYIQRKITTNLKNILNLISLL